MKSKQSVPMAGPTDSRIESACCASVIRSIDQEEIAGQVKLLAALADPTRLQIVTMLAGLDEPLCVCDITSQFDLGQPTISHHLKVLRDAKLVHWEKRGLWVYYSLDRVTLSTVGAHVEGLLGEAIKELRIA